MLEPLIVYSLLIVAAALIGGLLPLVANWRRNTVRLFISFGAGILLGAAFLHIIPEAAELIQAALGIPLLLGFLTLYIFEKFIMVHSCEAEDCDYHHFGWPAYIGLSLHSLITGVVLGTGILVPQVTLVIFLAIFFHKIPESFSLASLLVHSRIPKNHIFIAILIFSLIVPASALATLLIFESVSTHLIGWMLAFSAGTFLHVAADDLLPEVHSAQLNRKTSLAIFLGGLFIMWISHSIGA